MKKRHQFYYHLLRPLVKLFLQLRFGYRCKMAKNLPENYIVISNHTTNYDMLFVGSSFRRQMYFVGSEHIARWKRAYKLIRHAFDPIIRRKGASAGRAVIEILKVLRAGGNVCLFAEGVRSWDGVTAPILPSTAQLVKSAGCGLVTYRITGGYFASPMWCGSRIRRGPVRGAPVRSFTKEQLSEMTVEEIYDVILTDLHEDAYARQAEAPQRFRGKELAEKLENLLFICPECGGRDTFRSKDDEVRCEACGHTVRYDEYGAIHGSRFTSLKEWSDWQKEQVLLDLKNGVAYTAAHAKLVRIEKHVETHVTEGEAVMTAELLRCGEMEFPMSTVLSLAMHDQRAVVFSAGKEYFEMLPAEGFNTLKFMLYYDACKALQIAERR